MNGEKDKVYLRLPGSWRLLAQLGLISTTGHGGQVVDQWLQVRILCSRFKPQAMLERNGESIDEVDGAELLKEILLAQLFRLCMSLLDVDPY